MNPTVGITEDTLFPAGVFDKPHGIRGEITALPDDGIDAEMLRALGCVVVELDGIFVPFFLRSVRPKSGHSVLLAFDDIDDEVRVAMFKGLDFYVSRDHLEAYLEDNPEAAEAMAEAMGGGDDNAVYAADLVGLDAWIESEDGPVPFGEVTSYDDATENVLLHLTPADRPDDTVLVPFASEFISDLDIEGGRVTFDLPEGLLKL